MTEPARHNDRPIDREYLDLRLSELESKLRTAMAEMEARLVRAIYVPLWVAMLGLLGALFTAVIVR